MPEFDPGVILGNIVEGLTKFSQSIQVIGDPIEAAGKMIIPAVVVRVGFGAGGGSGAGPAEEGQEGQEGGGGGGGGGAVMLTPVFLIVDSEGERMLTVPSVASSAGSMIQTIKDIVDNIAQRRKEKEAEEDEQAQEES